jgi:hypothetical protein
MAVEAKSRELTVSRQMKNPLIEQGHGYSVDGTRTFSRSGAGKGARDDSKMRSDRSMRVVIRPRQVVFRPEAEAFRGVAHARFSERAEPNSRNNSASGSTKPRRGGMTTYPALPEILRVSGQFFTIELSLVDFRTSESPPPWPIEYQSLANFLLLVPLLLVLSLFISAIGKYSRYYPNSSILLSSPNIQQRNPHSSDCALLQCLRFGGDVRHWGKIGDNLRWKSRRI